MIIDFRADPAHASQYEILDATTWQPLPMDKVYSEVWYADDQRGILRIYLLGKFAFESDPQTPRSEGELYRRREKPLNTGKYPGEWLEEREPICVAWREERRPIRIVKKERFKEACQFDVGDIVFITPDKLYPKGIKARVIEVDGHPGDSGLLLCEWTNESGRLVTALHNPKSLLLVEKAEHVS